MYGEVVDGIAPGEFEAELAALKQSRDALTDLDLTAEDLAGLIGSYLRIYDDAVGRPFPEDPREQLIRAIRAVFSNRGMRRGRRSTAMPTGSRTISGQP